VGIEWAVGRSHRRIGMSGGLMANAILREPGHTVTAEEAARLLRLHAEAYARLIDQVRPLPGARELLAYLSQANVPWAIATSGRIESARPTLETLGAPAGAPVVTRDQVGHAKARPALLLGGGPAAGGPGRGCGVGGGRGWGPPGSAPGGAAGGGLPFGWFRQGEPEPAGTFPGFQDPADLLRHLDEVGVRAAE